MNAEFQIILRDKRVKTEKEGSVIFTVLHSGEMEASEIYFKADGKFTLDPGNYLILPVHGDLRLEEDDLFPSQFRSASTEKQIAIRGFEQLSRFLVVKFHQKLPDFSGEYSTETRNLMQRLVSNEIYSLHLGIFDGRKESEHTMTKTNALVFCVNGAFEFQDRLIETCDSLLIKNDSVLEMEALSENAIVIILEF